MVVTNHLLTRMILQVDPLLVVGREEEEQVGVSKTSQGLWGDDGGRPTFNVSSLHHISMERPKPRG